MTNTQAQVRTYGNWRRPTTPGLLGLGMVGTIVLLAGLVATVITVMFGGLINGVIVFAIMAGFLLTVAVKDKHGQSALTRTTNRLNWMRARSSGSNLYRSGPLGRTDWGTAQLPGLAAQSRLSEYTDSYGRPFAMVYVPSAGDYTVVIGTEPDGAALVDQEQIDSWVADWGHWLANLGDEAGIVAAALTIETAPDTGRRLRGEVNLNIDPEAPAFAQAMLREVVASYPSGSATVRAYVSITFAAATRANGRRRDADEMGRELAARLPGLTQALSATGAGAARPLGAQQLCEVIRIAYDPEIAELIDDAHQSGEPFELRWSDVGPSGAQANWDSYRHDSAVSVTWQMTEAPRGIVQANILTRFLAPHRDIARKRVTWLYRPIDVARAAAIVQSDLRAASFNMTSSDRPTARDVVGTRAAMATAEEEANGAGLVNFGMVVTATVTDPTRAADAKAAIENLSATARLRLRVVTGAQDSAFAAALPLGIVVPKHLKLPAELRGAL
ncbi:SCO6880 family protein [Leifsonia sp. NCR5]|uniref:SCO6880 family protein n=1 Tax=Leifsonia sp. NCR5 TaxID=1978342 RepID=UPI0015C44F5F|nr:SCO6880 family protein [Leifsonia sp. NCR5]